MQRMDKCESKMLNAVVVMMQILLAKKNVMDGRLCLLTNQQLRQMDRLTNQWKDHQIDAYQQKTTERIWFKWALAVESEIRLRLLSGDQLMRRRPRVAEQELTVTELWVKNRNI